MVPSAQETKPRRNRARAAAKGGLFRRSGRAVSLEEFLAPTGTSEFFSSSWEKTPRLIKRGKPQYHAGLLSTADLDAVLSQIKSPNLETLLRVVRQSGKELLRKTIPDTRRGSPDIQSLYKWMTEGYTLVLNELDQRWAPISMLARSLEERLNHRVGVNAYFTPPRSQGFLPHSDDHDVFILQLEGTKSWRIYEPLIELPTGDVSQEAIQRSLGAPAATFALDVGDMLYIPRGWIHECATSKRASLHLTVGVHVYRWLDFAQQALILAAEKNVVFRKAISPDLLNERRDARILRGRWNELLSILSESVDADEAMGAVVAKFIDGGQPPLDGLFARTSQAERLTLNSLVARRVGMRCLVTMREGVADISFAGNSVSGPFLIDPALRYIMECNQFRVKDLPDSLDAESKLVLIRRLIKEGLLSTA